MKNVSFEIHSFYMLLPLEILSVPSVGRFNSSNGSKFKRFNQ